VSSCHFYMTGDDHTSNTVLITQTVELLGPSGRENLSEWNGPILVKKWPTIGLSQGQGFTSHKHWPSKMPVY
jgi:hypothetical protein